MRDNYRGELAFLGLTAFAFAILAVAGWFTHLYVCFTTAAWGFLIAGAIFFPIGVFHGWGSWFGIW